MLGTLLCLSWLLAESTKELKLIWLRPPQLGNLPQAESTKELKQIKLNKAQPIEWGRIYKRIETRRLVVSLELVRASM